MIRMTGLIPMNEGDCLCATCKEPIMNGSAVVFTTTKTGLLKIHHTVCPKDKPVEVVEFDIDIIKKHKGFWKRLFCENCCDKKG